MNHEITLNNDLVSIFANDELTHFSFRCQILLFSVSSPFSTFYFHYSTYSILKKRSTVYLPNMLKSNDFNYTNAECVSSNAVKYQLDEGVYVITQFKATTRGVSHLRVCGSRKAHDFLEALNYYHLWSIDSEAKKLLQKDITVDSTVRLGKNQKLLVKAAEKETINDKIKRECLYVRMGDE